MKRIVFYMPSFEGGGAERNAVLIANQLARSGYRVTLTVDKESGPNRVLVREDITVRVLGGKSHIADVPALRKIIKEISPDMVFGRIGLSPIKLLLATIGLMPWRGVVLSYHCSYDPFDRPGGRMTYVLSSFLTRVAGATIAVSSDIRDELVSRFYACRDRIRVVHNPIDLQWIEMNALEERPSCFGKRPYILSVGRLVGAKDYPNLLRAFDMIKNQLDYDLVILGEGPLRSVLENLVSELELKDRVYMPGYFSNPFPVYRDAALFVLSSAVEGFGNVILEALALGVPVVATRCPGGPKEILDEGKYGRLVPVGDSNALAVAMIDEISNPVPPALLKRRASDFRVECVAKAYVDSVCCGF